MSVLKTSFAVQSKYKSFYTGGKIQVTKNGLYLFCGCGNVVNVLEIESGKLHMSFGEEEDEEISSFCLTQNDQYLVIATHQLLLRQWDLKDKKLIRTWKAIHFAPVVTMTFDSTSTLLATGSADSTIKLWDIEHQYCTHNLRGHQGIISVVSFHPDISQLQLYSAGEDYKIRIWDLKNSVCIAEIAAHYSLVTSMCFADNNKTLFTSGRDGVVNLIDTDSHLVLKTIPVIEVVESLILLPIGTELPGINVNGNSLHFITAGDKGVLRVWNSKSAKCVFVTDIHAKQNTEEVHNVSAAEKVNKDSQNIVQTIYNREQNIVTVVTFDQNILLLALDKLNLVKQFSGNNDEILDVKYFGEDERYVVVSTNSMYIKVFELTSWDCEIVSGHTDTVLCIDVIKNTDMFISCGKDSTVRMWKMNPSKKQVTCLAIGQGHTHAVGCLALSKIKPKFFVSGSEDCTLKLWTIPGNLDPTVTIQIHAAVTEKAHEKTISSVVVAPNDKFIATGSMDKTAKIWNATDLSLVGVMRGHKRGIWCVEFSPVDQILATSSGDGTVKLWSLMDFTCLRTFEGHDCAVLKVTFITRGMQILSSGTNGLIKLWTIKNNECVKTLDEHEDKVWALAVKADGDTFITGSADSNLIIWKDVTETEQEEVRQKQEQFILQEQELSNLILQKKYMKAIGLAITLEQPFRLLTILKDILTDSDGEKKLQETLELLRLDQIDGDLAKTNALYVPMHEDDILVTSIPPTCPTYNTYYEITFYPVRTVNLAQDHNALLRFAVQWNTNSRHCHEVHVVLSAVLRMYPLEKLKEMENLKSSVEGLLPYSERHFSRLTKLVQQSMFLEYTWQCMKNIGSDIERN